MDLNQKIKNEIVSLLAKNKIKIKIEDLETPPSAEMGDFGMPCFNLAKDLKKSPVAVAKELAGQIKPLGLIVNIKAVGPYLNFMIDLAKIGELAFTEIFKQKNKYGQSKLGKNEKVMIEFSALNTHKEIHVGHLRNICIGASLVNIYRNNGYKVIAASYLGDTGAHVAKTLWYLQTYVNQTDYPHGKRELGEFLGKSYTSAVAKITDHPEFKDQSQELLKKLEDGDKNLLNLWQQTRQWSLDLFEKVFNELGVRFDIPSFFESEEEKAGQKMIAKLLKLPFIRESEGAVIADLEKYNLGILVLLRKDGTALYGIKDIPLAIKKFKKYKVKKSIYVVDVRQAQYLAQIFKILELMGFKKDMIHVPYQFVQLKSGMISSRTGNVVTYEEVKQAALSHAILETKKRHADWSDDKVLEVSTKIVMAGLKFGMLKNGNDKIITFDIEESLDTQGLTGPYLQYTLARINSILKKIESQPKQAEADYKHLASNIEKNLIKDLIKFGDVTLEALKINDPSVVAQYLFNLSQNFNAFYHELPVLKAEPEIMLVRLQLIEAVKQVLANGMELLGIPTLEEM
jgi:arginyl-tRNA synthetase